MVSVESKSSGTVVLTAKCKNLAVILLELRSLDDANATARSVEILSNLGLSPTLAREPEEKH